MASGFKQQCPSCEAMVPVRDPNLIGRKIDCPTCKYRFVVEEPAEEPEPEPAKAPKGAAARKPAKDAPAKTKPTRRRDEDDEDEKPRAKSDSGSTKLIVGLLAGLVGVALIGVAIFFAFFNDSGSVTPAPRPGPAPGQGAVAQTNTPTPSTPTPSEGSGAINVQVPVNTETPATPGSGTEPPKPGAATTSDLYAELTNLLPNDAQGIIHVPFKELHKSTIGNLAFDVPGAFSSETFEKRVGLRLDEIERSVHASNYQKNWSYHVIRTTRPINFEAVRKQLNLQPLPGGKSDYLVGQSNEWLDSMFRNKEVAGTAKLGPLAVLLHNPTTLIFGDVEPIQSFVGARGRFTPLHRGPFQGIAPPGPAAGSGTTDAPPVSGIGGGVGLDDGPARGRGGAIQLGGGAPAGDGGTSGEGPAVRPHFATIPVALKGMLDRLEQRPTLVSMAFDARAARGRLQRHIPTYVNLLIQAGFSTRQLDQGAILGLAVQPTRAGFHLLAQLDCVNGDDSRAVRKLLLANGPNLVKLLEATFGIRANIVNDQNDPGDTPPAGGGGDVIGGGRGVPISIDGGLGTPPRQGLSGDLIRGSGSGATTIGGGNLGASGTQGGQPEVPAGSITTIEPTRAEKLVQLRVNLVLDEPGHNKLKTLVTQYVRQLRGEQELATGFPRWREVGEATVKERDKLSGTYPRGTYPRDASTGRAGIPYLPSQRVSWMASLLPHLGYDMQPNLEKSWRDPENLPTASLLVTQFIDPRYPRSTWWVRQPGMTQDVAATHLVGVAGLGIDAAEYKADDPNAKGKLGVFGYDRVAKLSEITDGAEHTMMMIQVPPTFKRPWMAGGGATVMGIPDPPPPSQRSVTPFVSTRYNNKPGTMAIMADGSVRFIGADISDEVFKGMATIQGGDAKFLDRDVPTVKEGDGMLATLRPAPTPTPQPVGTAPATKGFPPIAQWKEHSSAEGGFSVLLPGNPQKAKQTIKSPAGDLEFNMFLYQHGVLDSAGVVYLTYPPAVVQAGPEAIYAGAKAGATSRVPGGKLIKEEKVTVAGQPGREFLVDVAGKAQVRLRIVLIKDRLYQITISGSAETVASADAEQFFGSFKLLK